MKTLKRAFRDLGEAFSGRAGQLMLLFALEGFLYQFVTSLSGSGGFGTNLYATNLGATDTQIGMVQLVGNLAAVVLMLPVGIVADRTKNAKTVPMAIMIFMGISYAFYGSIPMLESGRMTAFFTLLPLTAGVLAVYNAIWQAFFGDVTSIGERNAIYSVRNGAVLFIAVLAPILIGPFLTAMPDQRSKLRVLQVFMYICAGFNLFNAFILARIPGGRRTPEQLAQVPKVSPKGIAQVVKELAHSRRFLAYFIPVMIFYTSWHFDWSMWYIAQTQYIGLNETELSIYSALTSGGQLLLVPLFKRMVDKRGTQRTFIWSLISLILCPVSMMAGAYLPEGLREPLFIMVMTVVCAPQAATNICLVQMLLDAIGTQNRSLIVSLNMICVTLSNALLPYLGVKLYTAMGSDRRAFTLFMLIELAYRTLSIVVYYFVQYRRAK